MANEENRIKKVTVNRDLCIGAASCVVAAADYFALDGENKAVIKEGGTANDETLMLAAQSCPTKAIFLFDGEGKQLYP